MRVALIHLLWLLPIKVCFGWISTISSSLPSESTFLTTTSLRQRQKQPRPLFRSSINNEGFKPEDDNNAGIEKVSQEVGTDEDDCFDLCDIDWDLMPQSSDDEAATSGQPEHQQQQQQPSDASASLLENLFDEQFEEEKQEDVIESTATRNRLRLEMQWQLWKNEEDCDVAEDVSTCGAHCKDCDGRGWQLCRFCHGKGMVWMGDTSVATECLVCSRARKNRDLVGTEMCRSCRGTGWVAPWTSLARKL